MREKPIAAKIVALPLPLRALTRGKKGPNGKGGVPENFRERLHWREGLLLAKIQKERGVRQTEETFGSGRG